MAEAPDDKQTPGLNNGKWCHHSHPEDENETSSSHEQGDGTRNEKSAAAPEESFSLLSLEEPSETVDEIELDFDATQCLFCPYISADFDSSLQHMLQRHGLFIPDRNHLVIDQVTMVKYCHFIIFGYFECLYCGSERSSALAAQQHMIGKGHCKIDLDRENSEFRDFYDFDSGSDSESGGDDVAEPPAVPSRSAAAVQVDDQSLRLESGKVLTHRSQAKVRPRKHRRTTEAASIPDAMLSRDSAQSSQALDVEQAPAPESKRVAKLAARFDHHLTSMRVQDRRSIMHFPLYEQRALVAKSKRQVEHARKAENEMLLKIQLRANKTIKK